MSKKEYLSKPYANEDQMTAQTNMYISHNYPLLRGMYYHIPNGGERSKQQALLFKAMGVLAGVPDFAFEQIRAKNNSTSLSCPDYYLIPAWKLELKMSNGVVSQAQINLHKLWRSHGICIEIAWSKYKVCIELEKRYGLPVYQ